MLPEWLVNLSAYIYFTVVLGVFIAAIVLFLASKIKPKGRKEE